MFIRMKQTKTRGLLALSGGARIFLLLGAFCSFTTLADAPRVVVDNQDEGFDSSDSNGAPWATFDGPGTNEDFEYTFAGDGSATATWRFEGLVPGDYKLSATWVPFYNRVVDAPYTVTTGSVVETVLVDQFDPYAQGNETFEKVLGTFTVAENDTLQVQLTNDATWTGAVVVADAVIAELLDPEDFLCAGRSATIIGSDNADVLEGTSGDDVILGLGGNDLINGKGGNDVICGGEGDDAIFGNGGDDTLLGESGKDTLVGGNGSDLLKGGGGKDVLLGKRDDDILRGNGGDDRLFGGSGNDRLIGGKRDDILFGEGGEDTLDGGDGTDTCDASNGANPTAGCEISF
jgi:Ca2+-binding RTX toxin-like protein